MPVGDQLALVDLGRADARVGSLAEVESVDVTRTWPDVVRIAVVERTAVAAVELAGRLRGLDADGVVFRDYKAVPKGMPRVRPGANAGTDALREAATVVSALPDDLVTRVDHVEVATVDQITLVMRDQREVLWGSAEESELKAQVVDKLLAAQKAPSTTSASRGTRPTAPRPGRGPRRPSGGRTEQKFFADTRHVGVSVRESRPSVPSVWRKAGLT